MIMSTLLLLMLRTKDARPHMRTRPTNQPTHTVVLSDLEIIFCYVKLIIVPDWFHKVVVKSCPLYV